MFPCSSDGVLMQEKIGEECNHENKILIVNETKEWAM
jgi:hypothetical protein